MIGTAMGEQGAALSEQLSFDAAQAIAALPANRLRSISGGQGFTSEQLTQLLDYANAADRPS